MGTLVAELLIPVSSAVLAVVVASLPGIRRIIGAIFGRHPRETSVVLRFHREGEESRVEIYNDSEAKEILTAIDEAVDRVNAPGREETGGAS